MRPQTAPAPRRKNPRLYIRATRAQQEALRRAARARYQDTTAFVLQTSLHAAQETLADAQKIVLSERDFARFVALIETLPSPTQNLRDLIAGYQNLKATHTEANL